MQLRPGRNCVRKRSVQRVGEADARRQISASKFHVIVVTQRLRVPASALYFAGILRMGSFPYNPCDKIAEAPLR